MKRGCTRLFVAWCVLSCVFSTAGLSLAQEKRWEKLSPIERYDAYRRYRKHLNKPREERQRIERQYQKWRSLSEAEKERIRRNYERYRRLSPEEKERFRRKLERWRRTPHP
ncbi:MAG: hypothetical protein KatS3mg076_1167 [Candidatus Binatia bacterium]|nr:MAG: hypothetical protein KatS3mg076_1167 [Candidatus Binatia bacterium]